MDELIWLGKKRNNDSKADVTITVHKPKSSGSKQSAIRFRRKSHLRITKNLYFEFAITNNRIYFRESTPNAGYKLCDESNEGNSLGAKITIDFTPLVGDYELLWDDNMKLNYIDISKKRGNDNG